MKPLTMKEKIQRRGGSYPTREEWDKVDWRKPQKQIAIEMRVAPSTVSRQQSLRGVYSLNRRHGRAMQLLKEVDAGNQKSMAAMAAAGREMPPKVADLVNRINKFLNIDRQ